MRGCHPQECSQGKQQRRGEEQPYKWTGVGVRLQFSTTSLCNGLPFGYTQMENRNETRARNDENQTWKKACLGRDPIDTISANESGFITLTALHNTSGCLPGWKKKNWIQESSRSSCSGTSRGSASISLPVQECQRGGSRGGDLGQGERGATSPVSLFFWPRRKQDCPLSLATLSSGTINF